MIKKLSQRFDELIEEAKNIENQKYIADGMYGKTETIEQELLLQWKVKVSHLLSAACGHESQHFLSFQENEKLQSFDSYFDIFKRINAVLLAASEDYKGGYLTTTKNLVQAEVFESELEQAEELLSKNYTLAAAVIAGVVLETALRDLCANEDIAIGKLDKMNADLAKAGKYNKFQQKQITAIADIRNSAAHGKSEEFTADDVENMIRDIERFLSIHLA